MPGNVQKIRAFIAIHPPQEVIEQLINLMTELKRHLTDDAFRWAKVEQLHLTLQFLGYIPGDRVDEFQEVIGRVVSLHEPFYLRTESLGCFPALSRARVLWGGLTGEVQELSRLKSHLDDALRPLGYQPETRPFHPHLTFARISNLPNSERTRFQGEIESHATWSTGEFAVQRVDLMQSVLSPTGASYRVINSFPLKMSETERRSIPSK